MKGDLPIGFSPSSSFDLTNSFWTSSICWFISRNCARSESIESEERVFRSGILRAEVLAMGVYHLITFLTAVGMALPEQRFRWFPGSRSAGTTGVSTTSKVPSVIFGRVCLDCQVAEVAIHITLRSTC
ncbi:hypothetical protein BHE74_00041381 [Ensete ventricosum]|nr:hypothetical protein BHE74_00041381 [Ensete ventricosum]